MFSPPVLLLLVDEVVQLGRMEQGVEPGHVFEIPRVSHHSCVPSIGALGFGGGGPHIGAHLQDAIGVVPGGDPLGLGDCAIRGPPVSEHRAEPVKGVMGVGIGALQLVLESLDQIIDLGLEARAGGQPAAGAFGSLSVVGCCFAGMSASVLPRAVWGAGGGEHHPSRSVTALSAVFMYSKASNRYRFFHTPFSSTADRCLFPQTFAFISAQYKTELVLPAFALRAICPALTRTMR